MYTQAFLRPALYALTRRGVRGVQCGFGSSAVGALKPLVKRIPATDLQSVEGTGGIQHEMIGHNSNQRGVAA